MARKREANTVFGSRMKESRGSTNKSQKEVAADLHITPQVLMNYERGVREPDFDMLNKIAQYYEVSVDYLTGNSDFKTPVHENIHDKTNYDIDIINILKGLSDELTALFHETLVNTSLVDLMQAILFYKKHYSTTKIDPIYMLRAQFQPNFLPDQKTYTKERFMPFINRALDNLIDKLEV